MLIEVGFIFIGIAIVLYTTHLYLVRYFYEHSFAGKIPRMPLWQVGYEYNAIVSWCLQEGTMPRWVKRMGSTSVSMFLIGVGWSIIAIFI